MNTLFKSMGASALLLIAVVLFIRIVGCYSRQFSFQTTKNEASPACTAPNFTLAKTKAKTEYGQAKITGIVTNHCTVAAGVQLKWTAFNADGSVAFSSDFWPASTRNIPPQTDYPFEMMENPPSGKWTYTVEPISTTVW